jgi:3-phosphoshikimate 1-carboxyvinyltransferase
MLLEVQGSPLRGQLDIPGSKSHTIRAVAIAAMAEGQSVIERPLESADGLAAVHAYSALGAKIEQAENAWIVQGCGGQWQVPDRVVDVGNSGTTMLLALASAALLPEGVAILEGDEQVNRRPCGQLEQALNALGASVESTRANGCPPYVVRGRLHGGTATVHGITSQYVSALLLNCPLAEGDTHLDVPLLNEKPYVGMTLAWLERQGIKVSYAEDYSSFDIPGGQRYQPVNGPIPGDFSSATFFLAAGALQDNDILCRGLDLGDTQGDKAVVEYLRAMGAKIVVTPEGIRVSGQGLQGCEIDLNATPDALPMMSVVACFAKGSTKLVNVPQARLKETDRIAVMRQELEKLGAKITERPDGLVIEESPLAAATVEGHGDHRVVMSLAIAGAMLPGITTINGYEAVNITYPGFAEAVKSLGGRAHVRD